MDVILDVDPGVDDAMAILLALASDEINILALTVVSGNVPLRSGVDNALKVLAFSGRSEIPVYAGADAPLVRAPVHAKQVHGETGLGNAELASSEREARPGASEFIQKTLTTHPGKVTVLAVGPLTNLALAERIEAGTLARAKQVVVMGGAANEPGNSSPTAEFNFVGDPHAAREVIQSRAAVTLIPLDVTHQVGIPAEEIDRKIRPMGSGVARFFCEITDIVVGLGREAGGYVGVYLHDPAAVVYALRPELFDVVEYWCDIETEGELTLGQLVVDQREGLPESRRRGVLTRIAVGVSSEEVLGLFRQRVLKG
ncbi:MAG: nucleoside hydrolase [Gemmatimonadetes bacterium]|jgi:purine nucleosidase|nr:nucleoside hydrolase [Gemmatimonadota bacterium]